MSLNTPQERAVHHVDGPLLVLAGPGSGKTLVITERTKYLIEQCQIPEETILVVSFSRASAMEMKERYLGLVHKTSCKVHFSTFHSLFFSLLREFSSVGKDDVITFSQQYSIVVQWRQRFYQQEIQKIGQDYIMQEEEIKNDIEEIDRYKNKRANLEEYEPNNLSKREFSSLIQFYEKVKTYNHKIDFHDMEIQCLSLLQQNTSILGLLQNRFSYFMVDEFQDINQTQFEIIYILGKKQENIFAVGDEDQSIYQFRGACPQIMLDFSKRFPHSSTILLDQNYRSGKSIVELSQKLINFNSQRFEKKVHAQKNALDRGICFIEFEDEMQEGEWVVETLRKKINQGQSISDAAILFRTHTCGGFLASRLFEQQIPFRLSGFLPDIHQHFIGKDILAYFRLAHTKSIELNKADFLRVINKPLRYVPHSIFEQGETTWEAGMNFFSDQHKEWMCDRLEEFRGDLKHLSYLPPYAGIIYLVKAMGYDLHLKTMAKGQEDKEEQWNEVLGEITNFAKKFKSYEDWIKGISLYQERLKNHSQPSEGISLMTMHGSKGLEFQEVYLIDIVEGIVPYKKAIKQGMEEEERRLFYVALTRAKEKINVLSTKKRNSQQVGISKFIHELNGGN